MTKQMYLFLWVLICLMPFSVTRAEANKKPFVIPELKEWKGANGDFIPGNTTRITYSEKENGSRQVAEQLAADYQTLFGKQIPVVAGKGKAGDFVLQLKADKKLGDEGYAIQIKDRVILTAPTKVFSGQLVPYFSWQNKTNSRHCLKERSEISRIMPSAVLCWTAAESLSQCLSCGIMSRSCRIIK